MSEILKSFLNGYDEAGLGYKDLSVEETKEELIKAGIAYLNDSGYKLLVGLYTPDQLVQIGLLDNGVCAERERGNFNEEFQNATERWAYVRGLDVGSFDHLTRRAHEVLDKDFVAYAKFENFPEIFKQHAEE